jgi:hypothetical protein
MIALDVSHAKRSGAWQSAGQGAQMWSPLTPFDGLRRTLSGNFEDGRCPACRRADAFDPIAAQPTEAGRSDKYKRAENSISADPDARCFARETDHRTVGQGSGNTPLAVWGKREGL